jgi:hypothetical protein
LFTIETNVVGAPGPAPPGVITVGLTAGDPVIKLAPGTEVPGTTVTVTGTGFIITPPTSPTVTSPVVTSPPPSPVPPPHKFPLLFVLVMVAVVVLAVLVLVWLRRPPPDGHGPPDSTTAPVRARVSGSTPRPVMRNASGQPASPVRIEVHRQAVEPRIERRTRR